MEQEVLLHIKNKFPVGEVTGEPKVDSTFLSVIFGTLLPRLSVTFRRRRVEELHQRAAVHRSFVSDTTERFYFSTAYAVRQSGLLRDESEATKLSDARLQVIDLPSMYDWRLR